MEHKVQESLDTIESLDISTLGDLMVGEVADKDISVLQSLIDCQLTVEEIDTVITALADHKFIKHKEKILIRDKLNAQLKCWGYFNE